MTGDSSSRRRGDKRGIFPWDLVGLGLPQAWPPPRREQYPCVSPRCARRPPHVAVAHQAVTARRWLTPGCPAQVKAAGDGGHHPRTSPVLAVDSRFPVTSLETPWWAASLRTAVFLYKMFSVPRLDPWGLGSGATLSTPRAAAERNTACATPFVTGRMKQTSQKAPPRIKSWCWRDPGSMHGQHGGCWRWGAAPRRLSPAEVGEHPWLWSRAECWAVCVPIQELGCRSGKQKRSRTQVEGPSLVFHPLVPLAPSQPGSVLFIPLSTAQKGLVEKLRK